MAKPQALSFGEMLRGLRKQAGFTQADLAAEARISIKALSNLERGAALRPHPDTVLLLARALDADGPTRDRLVFAARRPVTNQGGRPSATRTLPRDVAAFTGRGAEMRKVAGTGGAGGVFVISGMPGIGKSAFAIHAAHELAGWFPDGQLFLRLFGHTPDQRPASPASALESLLLMTGLDGSQIPEKLEQRTALWLDRVAGSRFILVLDDALSSDQVRPLLPGGAESLVLITSREQLSGLTEARAVRLDELTPGQTAELIVSVADRPGLGPDDRAVADIARMCAGLPLAAGIMAGRLRDHAEWTPDDLAAEMADARDRLALMSAENLSVAAALQLSYRDLSQDQGRLFRRLGLHPGTDFDAWAAAALDGASIDVTRHHLAALRSQHLLAEPSRGRYRFHDLVREYARTLAEEDSEADRDAAAGRLVDYYLHTARRADRYLARRTPPGWRAPAVTAPEHAPELATRGRAASWMTAERGNLQAVAGYAAGHGRPAHAAAIAAATEGYLRLHGHWDQAAAMCELGLAAARSMADPLAEAGALTDLADLQRTTRDYAAATTNLSRARELCAEADDGIGEAGALTCLSVVQYMTGQYPAAFDTLATAHDLLRGHPDRLTEAGAWHRQGVVHRVRGDFQAAIACLRTSLELHRGLHNELGEATALSDLGHTQYLADDHAGAAITLDLALTEYRDLGERLGEANTLQYLGLVQMETGEFAAATGNFNRALDLHEGLGHAHGIANALVGLGAVQERSGDYITAAASLRLALTLYLEVSNRHGEAITLVQLGCVQLATGDYPAAETGLSRALTICRDLGDPLGEASALCQLGRVQQAFGDYSAAHASLGQAREINHRIQNSAGEADALNAIGGLLLATGQPDQAEPVYQQALALASEFNAPLEQARALEGIGLCLLQSGNASAGTWLRRSLAIWERISPPNAERVAAALGKLSGESSPS
jgi:tetratricopeptide (TPR) repeat protein/transcriptional regulator with XRE-family HTH domain